MPFSDLPPGVVDAAVVGGGMAGLAAAETLATRGFSVELAPGLRLGRQAGEAAADWLAG
jgi:NADPH-dependent 2,4-dienoyl-CoA reductase/sulfur reductase-like enzyme